MEAQAEQVVTLALFETEVLEAAVAQRQKLRSMLLTSEPRKL